MNLKLKDTNGAYATWVLNVPVDELNICACEGLSILLQFRAKLYLSLFAPRQEIAVSASTQKWY